MTAGRWRWVPGNKQDLEVLDSQGRFLHLHVVVPVFDGGRGQGLDDQADGLGVHDIISGAKAAIHSLEDGGAAEAVQGTFLLRRCIFQEQTTAGGSHGPAPVRDGGDQLVDVKFLGDIDEVDEGREGEDGGNFGDPGLAADKVGETLDDLLEHGRCRRGMQLQVDN